MTLTPGPYLWRMRPEDKYKVVEVFHDDYYGDTFCIVGTTYPQRPTQGHEFIRLVLAEEVEKAFREPFTFTKPEVVDKRWAKSRARRVASGEEQ